MDGPFHCWACCTWRRAKLLLSSTTRSAISASDHFFRSSRNFLVCYTTISASAPRSNGTLWTVRPFYFTIDESRATCEGHEKLDEACLLRRSRVQLFITVFRAENPHEVVECGDWMTRDGVDRTEYVSPAIGEEGSRKHADTTVGQGLDCFVTVSVFFTNWTSSRIK